MLHVSGQDTEGTVLGAISRKQVKAVIHLEGHGLVVKGGQELRANLALRGQGTSREGLDDLVSIVGAGTSLHWEDKVHWVGDTDLGEDNGLFGLVDDHVKAGGLAVEEESDHDREAIPILISHVLVMPVALDSLDVGPEADLHVLNEPLLNPGDFLGNIGVLHLEFDLINSLGLKTSALASFAQLGSRGTVLKKFVALPGISRLAAELLLLM